MKDTVSPFERFESCEQINVTLWAGFDPVAHHSAFGLPLSPLGKRGDEGDVSSGHCDQKSPIEWVFDETRPQKSAYLIPGTPAFQLIIWGVKMHPVRDSRRALCSFFRRVCRN